MSPCCFKAENLRRTKVEKRQKEGIRQKRRADAFSVSQANRSSQTAAEATKCVIVMKSVLSVSLRFVLTHSGHFGFQRLDARFSVSSFYALLFYHSSSSPPPSHHRPPHLGRHREQLRYTHSTWHLVQLYRESHTLQEQQLHLPWVFEESNSFDKKKSLHIWVESKRKSRTNWAETWCRNFFIQSQTNFNFFVPSETKCSTT